MDLPLEPDKPVDLSQLLREEFRHHLDGFYTCLKLAPPYHSVEKAIAQLASQINTLEHSKRELLLSDAAFRWAQYRQAFAESGLNQKHRGIIIHLLQSPLPSGFPREYIHFLETFS